tara:strand:- start:145 stop:585 length:441 start_codon:yes stop_codon:yes gene_type:complete
MAKISYNWTRVKRGDIIEFKYQNKEGRVLRRTILVLEPKLRNQAKNKSSNYLLHGIQLEVSNVSTNTKLQKILEAAGDVKVVDEKKKIYRVDIDKSTKQIYSELKSIIKQNGIYRTYNYDKAKKSQVFLEDLRLPPSFVKELIGDN